MADVPTTLQLDIPLASDMEAGLMSAEDFLLLRRLEEIVMALMPTDEPERLTGYGCATFNLATLTGASDAEQDAYLTALASVCPPGVFSWVRHTRYGIAVTKGYPNWNTPATNYWPRMYARPPATDVMAGRALLFEPILWVRAAGTPASNMCNPCAAPNFFGRNAEGRQVVADADNTWRRDIRINLDRLCWTDVGALGGEPYVSQALATNYRIKAIILCNEVDHWGNARLYYVADGEALTGGGAVGDGARGGGGGYAIASRSDVASLAGSDGLQTLFIRMYDHCRHVYEWAREKRPDVSIGCQSVIQTSTAKGPREFTHYDLLNFALPGGSPAAINDVCDFHQLHNHQRQDCQPDPFTGVDQGLLIGGWHYWKANEAAQRARHAAGLPDNTRPLWATEVGIDFANGGIEGRTDLYQLRRLKYGVLVLGVLQWGVIGLNFYAYGRSNALGYNLLSPANAPFGGPPPHRDADYLFAAMDDFETSDDIPFVAKAWPEYWNPHTWLVWMNQQQNPLDGGPEVCPFAEWNRVTFADDLVTMTAGGNNIIARKKKLYLLVEYTFEVEMRLSGSTTAQGYIQAKGYDKLDGLAEANSAMAASETGWTTLRAKFTPRSHGNEELPDPRYAVLRVLHNGSGKCEVRNPRIISSSD